MPGTMTLSPQRIGGTLPLASLCLVLGLTVSLVWGQTPTEIIIATTSVAPGTAFSITDVGTGESGSPPLRCLTSSPSTAVWLFPSGSTVPLGSNPVAPHGTIISVRQSTSINLYRGDGAITPAGQYCCGSPTFASQRLCVTLTSCPPLSLDNGMINYTDPTPLDVVATHMCNNGYELVGGSTRSCFIVGCCNSWNEGVITCSRNCGTPPSIANGTPGTPDFMTFGGTAIYTCINGHEVSTGVTMATVTCLAEGVWSTRPTCTIVDCGMPPSVDDGSPGAPSRTTFEGRVTYTCNNGYEFSPGDVTTTVSCLATGTWDTPPPCTVVNCEAPPSINNGSPGAPTMTTLGGTVNYTCDSGYVVSLGVTMATVTCLFNGMWSTPPTCLATCLDLTLPTNGAITYIPNTSPKLQNAAATYSCNNGYTLNGEAIRTCQANRTWSEVPAICLATCPDLPQLSNGVITYTPATRLEGVDATYSCVDGFQLSDTITRVCEDSMNRNGVGVWNGMEPTCIGSRIDAVSPSDPPAVGQSYSLMCTTIGADSLNPTINYQWFKTTPSRTQVGTNSPNLTFDPLVLSDVGQYSCETTVTSNLLTQIVVAVSDEYELTISTLFIQLLIRGVINCPEYRQNNANEIINDITTSLVEAIQGSCGCGFNRDQISRSFTQCFGEQIAYRAQLNQTSQSSIVELVPFVEQWVTNPGSLVVQGSLFQLNATCPLVIADQFVTSECPPTITRDQEMPETTTSEAPSPQELASFIGAIVGGVIAALLLLVLIIVAIVIIYLVSRRRRLKKVVLERRDLPAIPLSDGGQSAPPQPSETVDFTYDYIDDKPHPPKKNYNYSQNQAYGSKEDLNMNLEYSQNQAYGSKEDLNMNLEYSQNQAYGSKEDLNMNLEYSQNQAYGSKAVVQEGVAKAQRSGNPTEGFLMTDNDKQYY